MTIRYNKPPSQRQLRIAELLRSEIMSLLLSGVLYHPDLKQDTLFTISEIRVSADLHIATIFMTFINNDIAAGQLVILQGMVPAIRKIIFPKLHLKFFPQIRFVLDETAQSVNNINNLLAKITENC